MRIYNCITLAFVGALAGCSGGAVTGPGVVGWMEADGGTATVGKGRPRAGTSGDYGDAFAGAGASEVDASSLDAATATAGATAAVGGSGFAGAGVAGGEASAGTTGGAGAGDDGGAAGSDPSSAGATAAAGTSGGSAGSAGATVVPCPDADHDGLCDAQDDCLLGANTDANANGYADACETTLWEVASGTTDTMSHIDIKPPFPNASASFSLGTTCASAPYLGRDLETAATTTRIYDVATNASAAAFLACVQAPAPPPFTVATGLELWSGSRHSGAFGDDFTVTNNPRAALTGKHVLYFVRQLTFSATVFTDRGGEMFNSLRYSGSWRAVGY